jgi:hypothetical protein
MSVCSLVLSELELMDRFALLVAIPFKFMVAEEEMLCFLCLPRIKIMKTARLVHKIGDRLGVTNRI